jgi:erythromycin esterase
MLRTCLFLSFILSYITAAGQDKKLQEYIHRHAKEINASRPGFRGLSFLDTMLKNKRIIMLGESSHGTEEYAQTKYQLIQYLHEKLGFRVLLFESPMTSCTYVNITKDTTAGQLIRNSIQDFWHTQTIRQLFSYVKNRNILFGGFDPQFMPSPYPTLLFADVFNNYPAIKSTLLQLENRVAGTFKEPSKYLSLKDSFSMAYHGLTRQLEKLSLSPIQQWVKQIITTSSSYYARINEGSQRDSCMAKNIIWLAENLYPDEKIIVWAHNTHIDRSATVRNRLMGKLLSEHFKDQLYAVGFFMVHGTTALNNRKIVSVKDPLRGSLEDILMARGFKTAFIETSYPAFDQKISTWHWGTDRQKLNVFKSYNAVVLINGVTTPQYLDR